MLDDYKINDKRSEFYADYAENMIKQRKALAMTQSVLAERAKVSVDTIRRIEAGKTGSDAYLLLTISRILGMSYTSFSGCIDTKQIISTCPNKHVCINSVIDAIRSVAQPPEPNK